MSSPNTPKSPGPPRQSFATTHWSMVRAAGGTDAEDACAAMTVLCQTYWYPLYAYVRRSGRPPEDAEDMTQEFFVQLLEHNWVSRADRSKGRFRTFLLTAFRRFLANQWDKASCQKRGGHLKRVPLGIKDAESRFCLEPSDPCTPEQVFERQWAIALLEQVLGRLKAEYTHSGQGAVFEALKASLVHPQDHCPHGQLAAELGMTPGSVKVAAFRLRQRYRERLLEEIAHTVASPDDVESELRHLFEVLARR